MQFKENANALIFQIAEQMQEVCKSTADTTFITCVHFNPSPENLLAIARVVYITEKVELPQKQNSELIILN